MDGQAGRLPRAFRRRACCAMDGCEQATSSGAERPSLDHHRRARRRDHQHRAAVLHLHGLVVQVHADDRIRAALAGGFDHVLQRLGLGTAQHLFVAAGAAADQVAQAGEHVAEHVGAEDRVAADRKRGGTPRLPHDRPLKAPYMRKSDFKRARLILDKGPGAFGDGARHRFEVEYELPVGEAERHPAPRTRASDERRRVGGHEVILSEGREVREVHLAGRWDRAEVGGIGHGNAPHGLAREVLQRLDLDATALGGGDNRDHPRDRLRRFTL